MKTNRPKGLKIPRGVTSGAVSFTGRKSSGSFFGLKPNLKKGGSEK